MSDEFLLDERQIAYALNALNEISKTSPIINTVEIDITNVKLLATHMNYVDAMNSGIQQLKQEGEREYDIAGSYDCKHLAQTAIQKVQSAQQTGQRQITLENRCCSSNRCPKILLQQYVVDYFRVQTDNL